MTEDVDAEKRGLTWVTHPLVERPKVSIGLIGFIIFIFVMIKICFLSWWWVIISAILIFVSLIRYFLPTTYELTDDGVKVYLLGITTHRRPWSYFSTYYKSARGVVLSPFPKPSRLDTYRGVHLLCYENRDEVIDFVDTKLEKV